MKIEPKDGYEPWIIIIVLVIISIAIFAGLKLHEQDNEACYTKLESGLTKEQYDIVRKAPKEIQTQMTRHYQRSNKGYYNTFPDESDEAYYRAVEYEGRMLKEMAERQERDRMLKGGVKE